MAEIKVTPAVLRAAANNINGQNTAFQNNMTAIRTDMQAMKSTWEGSAAESFMIRFNQLEKNFATYYRVIGDYIKYLNTAADTYEYVDTTVERQNESLQNNLFA
jgi:WXG100 family type VII secretion target